MGIKAIFFLFFVFILIKPALFGQYFTVSGRIIHSETELPYSGAAVSVIDKSFGALSDEKGWFELKMISYGSHTLHIKAGGFSSKVIDLTVTKDLNLGVIALQPLKGENENVIGSYFLEEEWIPGHVDFVDDEEIKDDIRIKYRLDQYGFYIKRIKTGFAEFVHGKNIRSVTLYPFNKPQRTFINSNQFRTSNDLKSEQSFYEILVFGKMLLLKKTEAIYRRAKYQSSLGIGKDRNEILKKHSLFVSINNKITEMPQKNKSLLAILPQYKKEAEEFIKNNKLSIKNEGELKIFIQYYNDLIETNKK